MACHHKASFLHLIIFFFLLTQVAAYGLFEVKVEGHLYISNLTVYFFKPIINYLKC